MASRVVRGLRPAVLLAAALFVGLPAAARAAATTLGPTSPAGTSVGATADSVGQAVAAAVTYTVSAYPGTDLGTISTSSLTITYRITSAAPGTKPDTYQFDYSFDGSTWLPIVAATTATVATWTPVTISNLTTSWASIGSLQVRCLWTANGGPDTRAVEWDASGVAVTYTPPTPPAAPGAPSFGAVGAASIPLTWNAVTGANTYKVERSTDGVTFGNIASGVATNSYTDSTGLSVNTRYWYRIIATNGGG
ncbi:MAG TPA: fibronectin type III domain-containing protein, partial [Anaeromyxobacteraceae bacterium]|nr:fibronectin type III domain-containing protein [Anaeromyxobacteraceae bacterium]